MEKVEFLVPNITSITFHEREYSHLGDLVTGGFSYFRDNVLNSK